MGRRERGREREREGEREREREGERERGREGERERGGREGGREKEKLLGKSLWQEPGNSNKCGSTLSTRLGTISYGNTSWSALLITLN